MAALEVVTFPMDALRRKAEKVAKVGDDERATLDEMAKTMYISRGVGLAAVQVGIGRQLAVVDTGEGLIKMVNPVITRRDGVETNEEGCLSVPGACVNVKRARRIVVSFLDEHGEAKYLKAEGLLARAIQHEIDHLQGTLIIDYLNPIKRLLYRKTSRRARPKGQ